MADVVPATGAKIADLWPAVQGSSSGAGVMRTHSTPKAARMAAYLANLPIKIAPLGRCPSLYEMHVT